MTGQEELQRIQEIEEVKIKIRERFPDIVWPEPILEPIFFGRLDKTLVENRKLVLDAETGVQFDIVSDHYDLIPHEVATHNLLKAIPEEFGRPELKFHMWQDGARFRVEAHFPDVGQFDVKEGDPVRPRIIQTNSLDRSQHYGLDFGAEELVCANGLIAFKSRVRTRRRHIFGAEEVSAISENLKKEMENFSDQMDLWKQWADTSVGVLEEMEVDLENLPFSDAERDKLLQMPLMNHNKEATLGGLLTSGKATLWDINSAGTQYAKHEVNSAQRSFDLERKMAEYSTKLWERYKGAV